MNVLVRLAAEYGFKFFYSLSVTWSCGHALTEVVSMKEKVRFNMTPPVADRLVPPHRPSRNGVHLANSLIELIRPT